MEEPLGLLLLPARLEEFELAGHARDLLSIPRVIALEPGRMRTPRFLRDSAPLRTARRLRFPGEPRLIVVYDPRQYPLARALLGRYKRTELWYVRSDPVDPGIADDGELDELDGLARERATAVLTPSGDAEGWAAPLRLRMRELEIINPRAFVPGARIRGR